MIITAILLLVTIILTFKVVEESELAKLFTLTAAIVSYRLFYVFYYVFVEQLFGLYDYLNTIETDYSFLLNVDTVTIITIVLVAGALFMIGLLLLQIQYTLQFVLLVIAKIRNLFKN